MSDQQISQFRRRWQLLELLQHAERGLTAAHLLDRVKCGRMTLYRDLDFLTSCGMGLEKTTVNGEKRWMLSAPQLPPLVLSPLQMLALQLARGLLGPLEGTAAVQELDALLTRFNPRTTSPAAVSLAPPRVTPASTINRLVDQALRQRKQLRILYKGLDDTAPEPRTLDPLRQRLADNDLYLLAFDRDRRAVRTFKMVRIHGVEVLPDPADDHPEFDETAVFAGTIKAWSGTPVQVAVRLSARVAPVAPEYPLVADQRLEPQPDGSVVVHGTTAGIIEAMRWVLSWGREARVLAPQSLVDAVVEQISGALHRYDQS